jgi:adenylyltransferase/sulfurtransferase
MSDERYKRQQLIADWDQAKLRSARVMVIGAGTTGNELIKNLALLGVGHITIVDFDDVNEVNLSRSVLFRRSDIGRSKAEVAAQRACELNPALETQVFHGDIVHEFGSGRFTQYDAVCLATDNLASRMWVSRACFRQRVWLINTGIEGWNGNITVIPPDANVCIECAWSDGVYAVLDQRRSCAGIGLAVQERPIAMVITTAAMVAAMATQEFVKWVMYRDVSQWHAYDTISMNGLTGKSFQYHGIPNNSCRSRHIRIHDAPLLTVKRTMRVADVKVMLCQHYAVLEIDIMHDHEIIWSLVCRQCGHPYATEPRWLDGYLRHMCQACRAPEVVPDNVSQYLLDALTFEQMHIPVDQILTVQFMYGDDLEVRHIQVVD